MEDLHFNQMASRKNNKSYSAPGDRKVFQGNHNGALPANAEPGLSSANNQEDLPNKWKSPVERFKDFVILPTFIIAIASFGFTGFTFWQGLQEKTKEKQTNIFKCYKLGRYLQEVELAYSTGKTFQGTNDRVVLLAEGNAESTANNLTLGTDITNFIQIAYPAKRSNHSAHNETVSQIQANIGDEIKRQYGDSGENAYHLGKDFGELKRQVLEYKSLNKGQPLFTADKKMTMTRSFQLGPVIPQINGEMRGLGLNTRYVVAEPNEVNPVTKKPDLLIVNAYGSGVIVEPGTLVIVADGTGIESKPGILLGFDAAESYIDSITSQAERELEPKN